MERLMTQIIDKKIEKQNEIETYNIQAIYVGYIAKRLVQTIAGEKKVRNLVKSNPIIMKYSNGYCVDIENGNRYPVISLGQMPQNDDYYVPERLMYDYCTFCSETLYSDENLEELEMTSTQLREILNAQELKQQIYFN